MQLIQLEESDDIDAAAWIAPRMFPFNRHVVGSVVPTGFEAYAWIDHEREGLLPRDVAQALVEILRDHTEGTDKYWLALWDGQGYLHPGGLIELKATWAGPEPIPAPPVVWRHPPGRAASRPRLNLPQRMYILFRGGPDEVPGWMDGPNLWWPEDRAWCVASEIDLPFTLVGGSDQLVGAILDADIGGRRCSVDEGWN